jgi:hypothetical protein
MSVQLKSGVIFYSSHNVFKNDDCTICRQSLNDDSLYAKDDNYISKTMTGKCGHTFHEECILPWLKENTKCPICANLF